MTEADYHLPELPSGWVWSSLDYVAEIVTGTTPPKSKQENYGDKIPFIKPGDLDTNKPVTEASEYLSEIGSKKARIIPLNTIMVTCIGATIGKTGISGRTAVTNQQINSLIPRNALKPRYAYYYCLSSFFQDMVKSNASSTTLPILNKSKFSALVIPIAPISEQNRIVARIEELFSRLDGGVEALQKAKAQLQRYRRTVLKAAVEGRLTEEWRKAHPEVEPADKLLEGISKFKSFRSKQFIEENGEGLPDGWAWATMEQLTSKVTSGSRGWAQYYSDFGAIFIRAQDIKTDRLLLDKAAFVEIPLNSEGTRTRVQLGDILIVITGANVTKSAIVESDLGDAYVSQHVGLIRPATTDLAPYLYTYIIAPKYGRGVLKRQAYGAGKPGLNLDNIKNLIVRLPPFAEQRIIAEEVERCKSIADNIETIIEDSVKRADCLRQSILKYAFEGKLVLQDPNDEPASVLMERIEEERVKQELRCDKSIKRYCTHQIGLIQ